MLKQRIFTACVLFVLVGIVITVLPPAGFRVCMGLVLLIAVWEWGALAGLGNGLSRAVYALSSVPVLYMTQALSVRLLAIILLASLFWWLLALLFVLKYPRHARLWDRPWLLLLCGLPLLLPGWLGLLYLRSLDNHVQFLLLLLALVAAADIGAYFAGRRFGHYKLAPAVSPNKTWEGFAGGQLAACGVIWAFLVWSGRGELALNASTVLTATLGALLLAGSSVLGDLFESMIKRERKVKDSGTLLPGHGGVLDRIDGITAALPVFTLMLLHAGIA